MGTEAGGPRHPQINGSLSVWGLSVWVKGDRERNPQLIVFLHRCSTATLNPWGLIGLCESLPLQHCCDGEGGKDQLTFSLGWFAKARWRPPTLPQVTVTGGRKETSTVLYLPPC